MNFLMKLFYLDRLDRKGMKMALAPFMLLWGVGIPIVSIFSPVLPVVSFFAAFGWLAIAAFIGIRIKEIREDNESL